MATTNLNITEVAASQNNKEVTINDALEALDQGTQGSKAQTITGATSLSAADFTGYFAQILGGSPAAAFTLNVPATKRLFLIANNTGQTATVQVTGGGGDSVTVANGAIKLLYCDGADIDEAGGGGSAETTVSNKTDNYTVTAGDLGALLFMDKATANTVSLPDDATEDLAIGFTVNVAQKGVGATSFAALGVGTILTPDTSILRGQYSIAGAVKVAANTWLLFGDLTSSASSTSTTTS